MSKTAFLGPAYTFSERAACRLRGKDELIGLDSPDQILAALSGKDVDFAVLPFENSSAGYVPAAQRALAQTPTPFTVVDEMVEEIRFALYRRADDDAELAAVRSHEMSLKQCRGWIDARKLKTMQVDSNGAAFIAVREGDEAGVGAIGPVGIKAKGMRAVEEDLQGGAVNHTRFLLLAREPIEEAHGALVLCDDLARFAAKLKPSALMLCAPAQESGELGRYTLAVEAAWDDAVTMKKLTRHSDGVLLVWRGPSRGG